MAENNKSSSDRQQQAEQSRIIKEGYQPEMAGGVPTSGPPPNPPNQGSGGEGEE